MPRIRTLKPEHKQHRKIGPLSDREYRVWVGLVTEADDDGRLVADPAQLRALLFPYHPRVQVAHLEAALSALARSGLIRLYTVNGTRYADLPSWHDHQSINKRVASKLPPYNDSRSTPVALPEDSRPTPVGSESLGVFGKEGTEPSGGRTPGVPPTPAAQHPPEAPDPDSPTAVLAWLNAKAGTSYRPVPANLDLIRARLKDGITAWQLKAIVSRKVREWNHEPKPGDKDTRRWLRPATLFGKSKCEQYLGELPATKPDPTP